VSLYNSYALLWWMCSTSSDCVSLDSSCALLGVVVYHWIMVVYYHGSTLLCATRVVVYHWIMVVYYYGSTLL
jgi:hypothetical protein